MLDVCCSFGSLLSFRLLERKLGLGVRFAGGYEVGNVIIPEERQAGPLLLDSVQICFIS